MHNPFFIIDGDQLLLNQPLSSVELIPEYFVRLQSSDRSGAYVYRNFSFPVNHAPTDILASENSFSESIYGNAVVARLSVLDIDSSDTHVFKLVNGLGDSDNHYFNIVDDQILINRAPDYEDQSTYTIRVSAIDSNNLSVEKIFEFNVINEIEQPREKGFPRLKVS